MRDFINFKKMITPTIIAMIFWLGVIVCIIAGIKIIQERSIQEGVAFLILGPLVLRVICENLIILFSINANLLDIKTILKSQQDRENQ